MNVVPAISRLHRCSLEIVEWLSVLVFFRGVLRVVQRSPREIYSRSACSAGCASPMKFHSPNSDAKLTDTHLFLTLRVRCLSLRT